MLAKLLTGHTLEGLEKELTHFIDTFQDAGGHRKIKIHHIHSFVTQEVSGTPSISGPKVITKFSLMIIASYE